MSVALLMKIVPIICVGGGFIMSKYIKGEAINDPKIAYEKEKGLTAKHNAELEREKRQKVDVQVYVARVETDPRLKGW